MAALLVLLGGGAIIAKKSKGGSAAKGGRAVIVPTDRPRTVVVPPCATGIAVTAQNAEQQVSVTGSTRVMVPPGTGTRVVVVPRCPARSGGTLPSAAFVLGEGAKVPAKEDKAARNPVVQDLRSEVVVPASSTAATIVVPACSAKGDKGSNVVLDGTTGSTAVAPPC